MQPLTTNGVTVAIVDNVGWAPEARNRAKGASAKLDRVDLAFSCSTSAGSTGLIVKAQKVRSVRAAFRKGDEWLFVRDTQQIDRLTTTTGGDTEHKTFRPTVLMERVSKLVEANPGIGKKDIRKGVTGRGKYVDDALQVLVDDGYIERREVTGPHNSREHHHHTLRPFTEDADAGVPEGADQSVVSRRVPAMSRTGVPSCPQCPRACPVVSPKAKSVVSPIRVQEYWDTAITPPAPKTNDRGARTGRQTSTRSPSDDTERAPRPQTGLESFGRRSRTARRRCGWTPYRWRRSRRRWPS